MRNRRPAPKAHSRKNRALPILALTLTTSAVQNARADEYHYINTLVGERASTMGGAYTAISDDPTGIYYNPAGMVFGFENYLSVSTNTYAQTESKYKNIVSGHDYSLNSSSFVPSFLGFSQNLRKSKIAFAVIVPNSILLNQDDTLTDLSTTTNAAATLHRRFFQEDSTYLFGPGFSTALGEKASIGFSLLGSIRVGTLLDSQFVQMNPLGTGKYFSQQSQIKYTMYGMIPKLGLQFMPTPKWVIGATLSKQVHFSGKGSSRKIAGKLDNTGSPVTPNGSFDNDMQIVERDITITPARPWTISSGIAFFPSKALLFAADTTYYSSDTTSSNFRAQSMFNFALGTEWYPQDSLALRLGIYTDNANTAQVSNQRTDQVPHVNLRGVTTGITMIRSGSSFTLGLQYAKGNGQGQAIGGITTVQTVEQNYLSVHIAGSYQL